MDPPVSVDLPGRGELRIPSFPLGARSWCARFPPPEPGRYAYRVEGDAVPPTGELVVEPYGGENALYRRGPPQVAPSGRHLVYRDGSPFFWLADTWWYGATGRCPWPHVFRSLARHRARQGFTVIQMVVGIPPEVEPGHPSAANEGGPPFLEGWRVNPGYLACVDRRVRCLVDVGLVPCIVGGWGHHIDWLGLDNMVRYWRHLVARYWAFPVVWCLSGESDIHLPGARGLAGTLRGPMARLRGGVPALRSRRDAWERVGQAVAAADPGHRVITTHPLPGCYAHECLNGAPWVGLTGIQSGHGRDAASGMVRQVLAAQHFQPRRPIVNLEPWYEGILGDFWEADQRYAFWLCILAGAAGHSYGAHGIWQMGRAGEGFLPHWAEGDWRGAARYPGAVQMGIGRALLGRFRWWELEPRPEWITPHWAPGREGLPFLSAIPGQALIAYFPAAREPFAADLRGLQPGTLYRASWLDPRTGVESEVGPAIPDQNGVWRVPGRPSLEDWVLAVRQQES